MRRPRYLGDTALLHLNPPALINKRQAPLKNLNQNWKSWRDYQLKKVRPEFRYKHYQRGAKARGIEFSLTFEEFQTFWQKPCFYCEGEVSTVGLDRFDNTKGYSIDNVVSCCASCNIMKNNLSVQQFIEQCYRVAKRFMKE